MTIRNYIPELWSANVETALRKTLIYAGPMVCNRNYEGEIRNQGDTVKVTTVGRPTVHDYVPGQSVIVPEPVQTAQRVFQVDQAKSWAIQVDNIDKAQANRDFMPEATSEGGYATAETMDRFVAGLHTQIPDANATDGVTVDLTPSGSWDSEARKVYDSILVPLSVKLDEQDVPEVGRYVILPPWLYGVLRRDPRFIEADKSANAGALRSGQVGDAAGFTIMRSRNVPEPIANNFVVTAGTSKAITFAEQLTELVAYEPESSFSDALKALVCYGGKVFRPDHIVKTTVTKSA